jgi:glycosyltransferase involved in cell wall biosynthesis
MRLALRRAAHHPGTSSLRCTAPRRLPRCAVAPLCAASHAALPAGSSVLILSPVWPEWKSSAAGVRTAALVRAFTSWGWRVTYASTSDADNAYAAELAAAGVAAVQLQSNREAQLAQILEESAPDVVLFDRFTSEEMFSFRVRQLRPQALRVLDTQDLHALRRARAALHAAGASPADVLAACPGADDADAVRELSAIARCDAALICSPEEHRRLVSVYCVPRRKLLLASFFVPPPLAHAGRGAEVPSYGARAHVAFVGNYRHAPNADGAQALAKKGGVWDALRPSLPPGAECHLYGSYETGAARQLHDVKRGVRFLGHAADVAVLSRYRLLLAPLRFGAGIKGKLLDSWAFGTPCVTTPLGAEGCLRGLDAPWRCDFDIRHDGIPDGDWAGLGIGPEEAQGGADDMSWGGAWRGCDDPAAMAAAAAALYTDEAAWTRAQATGFALLRELFAEGPALGAVRAGLCRLASERDAARAGDFTAAMLWHHGARSTEFFARFIEAKEALAADRAERAAKEP